MRLNRSRYHIGKLSSGLILRARQAGKSTSLSLLIGNWNSAFTNPFSDDVRPVGDMLNFVE
jgi:hypothetical protein